MSCLLNWFAANKEALAGLASIFAIFGTVLAVAIFFSGVRQYMKAERWKKTEFWPNYILNFRMIPARVVQCGCSMEMSKHFF